MMAKVGTEAAFTQRERISSLSSVIREHRMSMGNASRRDRLLGLGVSSSSSSHEGESNAESVEFKEEDIWAADVSPMHVKSPPPPSTSDDKPSHVNMNSFGYVEVTNPSYIPGGRRWLGGAGEGLSSISRNAQHGGIGRVTSASRMIPQIVSSSSSGLVGSGDGGRKVVPQSAPVNVPDWSRIMGKSKSKNKSRRDEAGEGDGDEGEMSVGQLPPHELVARSQTTTFSVFEGAGRTLKGRDLSRVRNAVLKQTGFL